MSTGYINEVYNSFYIYFSILICLHKYILREKEILLFVIILAKLYEVFLQLKMKTRLITLTSKVWKRWRKVKKSVSGGLWWDHAKTVLTIGAVESLFHFFPLKSHFTYWKLSARKFSTYALRYLHKNKKKYLEK